MPMLGYSITNVSSFQLFLGKFRKPKDVFKWPLKAFKMALKGLSKWPLKAFQTALKGFQMALKGLLKGP